MPSAEKWLRREEMMSDMPDVSEKTFLRGSCTAASLVRGVFPLPGTGGALCGNLTAIPLPVSFLDIVGVLIVGMGVLWGGGQGLLSSVIALLALLFSALAARAFGDVVGGVLNGLLSVFDVGRYSPSASAMLARMSMLVGRGVVFILVLILLSILGRMVRRAVSRSPVFGWPDVVGGALFGGMVGVLLFVLLSRLLVGASWAQPLVAGSLFLPWVQKLWGWW